MYQFDSRVRYSEVNSEKQMTLVALVDYLQDCCTFQSEDMGIGVDYLSAHHCAWVLSSWEIKIVRYPKLAEHITVATWPYSFKGFYGYRNFTICDEAGEVCAYANSVWVFMDTEKMRPMRITPEVQEAYEKVIEPQIEDDWADRKVEAAEKGVQKAPVTVQHFHIDTNHHMNNGKYILVAEGFLSDDDPVESIRVEYKKAAVLGDVLYPFVFTEGDRVTVTLADEQEKPYATIQFKRKRDC